MYFATISKPFSFVPVIERQIKRTLLPLALLIALVVPNDMLQAQPIWPGDVNNDGVVNTVDVLYWAVAREARGPRRARVDSLWQAFDRPAAWERKFPGDISYAHADCNGDGVVDDEDLKVIQRNFKQRREGAEPAPFSMGDPATDPILSLTSGVPAVKPGVNIRMDIDLRANAANPIQDFFAIGFTIPFDPEVVDGRGANRLRFNIERNSWAGQSPRDLREFVLTDMENGLMHIVLYRVSKNNLPSGLGGSLGSLSIVVVEDIVLGANSLDLGLENIKMVNLDLKETPVAAAESSTPLEGLVSTAPAPGGGRLRMFPNPTPDYLYVDWDGEPAGGAIQGVALFNAMGQRLAWFANADAGRQQIDLRPYPPGMYIARIFTAAGVTTSTIIKQR